MMLKKVNILKILGMLMIALSVTFTLSGCSKGAANQSDKTEEELAEEHRSCWQDKVLSLLYDTMGTVAMGTYEKITKGALSFMMVAFAIWFAFRLLNFVSSPKDASGEHAEMWSEVLKKLLICFVCGFLASSTEGLLYTLNMIVFPIYNAFLDYGGKVLEAASKASSAPDMVEVFGEKIAPTREIICNPHGASSASLTGFPSGPRDMMNCMICSVNERLSLGNALAYKVMQQEGFMVVIVGLLLLACFMMIKLGFVFYLVDTIFRFTMMVVILPILIMAYAFDFTKSWTKKGMTVILNSAAFMMVIAILIAMALLAVMQILADNPATFNPQGDDAEEAFKELNPAVMAMLLIAFLIKNTLSVAQKMVSSIVGGNAEAKFQKKLKALVTMIGKGLLAWLTAGASKGVEAIQKIKKVQEAVEKVKKSHVGQAATKMHGKYKDFKDKYDKVKDKVDNMAGRG